MSIFLKAVSTPLSRAISRSAVIWIKSLRVDVTATSSGCSRESFGCSISVYSLSTVQNLRFGSSDLALPNLGRFLRICTRLGVRSLTSLTRIRVTTLTFCPLAFSVTLWRSLIPCASTRVSCSSSSSYVAQLRRPAGAGLAPPAAAPPAAFANDAMLPTGTRPTSVNTTGAVSLRNE